MRTAMPDTHRHGFTLLEVLVALAVVSIALIAALRASGSLQDNALRLRHAVLAEQCAENFLVEQRLQRAFLGVGTSTSACTEAGDSFTLQATVTPTPNPNFRRLNLDVFTTEGRLAWSVVTIIGNL